MIIAGTCPNLALSSNKSGTLTVQFGFTFHNTPAVLIGQKETFANAAGCMKQAYESYFLLCGNNSASSTRTIQARYLAIGY